MDGQGRTCSISTIYIYVWYKEVRRRPSNDVWLISDNTFGHADGSWSVIHPSSSKCHLFIEVIAAIKKVLKETTQENCRNSTTTQ